MTPSEPVTFAAHAGKPVIIDGGLATQLESRGFDLDSRLWSAALLSQAPQAIMQAHLDYLEAGARIIITASYQASVSGFMQLGHDPRAARELVRRSVDLALKAREKYLEDHPGVQVWVAASVGAYGACLADGSEYRGRYDASRDELRDFHAQRLEALGRDGIDLLACETIPCHVEAGVLGELVDAAGIPAWISFSCRDGEHIRDGTPIREVAARLRKHAGVFALGVNCTSPEHIAPLVGILKDAAPEKSIVAYPNAGGVYDGERRCWLSTDSDADLVSLSETWREAGADFIGGCCGIGPDRIGRLARHWGE